MLLKYGELKHYKKSLKKIFLVSVLVIFPQTILLENATSTPHLKGENEYITILTLNRLNYKPYKTLFYKVLIDQNCELVGENPFDVFYVNTEKNDLPRIDLSISSHRYFYPTYYKVLSPRKLEFKFKAFKEFNKNEEPLIVEIKKQKKQCITYLMTKFKKEIYFFDNITIQFDLFLGFISDVEYVKVRTVSPMPRGKNKKYKFQCFYGDCP